MRDERANLRMAAAAADYTPREEAANALTHGLAALLSVGGLVWMILRAVRESADVTMIASVSVFGAAMILLYTISTLYHAVWQPRVKAVLQVLDHSAIYLLIAGSYTPFCLKVLGGTLGTVLCAVVWTVALAGAILQPLLLKLSDKFNCALYLALGWCVVVALKPLIEALPLGGLWLLALGGAAYSVGVLFYLWEKLPFNHAVWHLFVVAGTALQFFSVLGYVIPLE